MKESDVGKGDNVDKRGESVDSTSDKLLADSGPKQEPSKLAPFEINPSIKPADALPFELGPAASKECPVNPVYGKFIDEIFLRSFDTRNLGDREAVRSKDACSIKTDEDAVRKANEFLESTPDPYDKVFSKQEMEAFRQAAGGNSRNIGVILQTNLDAEEREEIRAPFLVEEVQPGSSAETYGLKVGDKITRINGRDATEFSNYNAMKAFGSEGGDKVQLSIERDGVPMELEIPKQLRDKKPVSGRMEGNIAYIKINTFLHDNVAEDLKAVLERYKDAQGYVIDLRDNGGGYFSTALQAASLFVDKGVLVRSHNKLRSEPGNPQFADKEYGLDDQGMYEKVTDPNGTSVDRSLKRFPDLVDKPVIILTNGRSASASEIFAAALRDNGAATIKGTRSFGKGEIQTIDMAFPNGTALKVTTGEYTTPAGRFLGDGAKKRYGIIPDQIIKNSSGALRGSQYDSQLRQALTSMEINNFFGPPNK
ncbi:MAG: PDZ domain-containing protein [Candidatus Obscuribacterales bacterium]|nr:PDZ domain-containing protein [Candidatus Obscuribacterales bacterium]